MLTTVLGLCSAIYVQKIVDNVLVEGNENLLNVMTVGMIFLLLVQVVIGAGKTLIGLRTGQKIDAALITAYYQHLIRLPQSFFDTMRVGEVLSRVNDAVKIRIFLNDIVLNLVVSVAVMIFAYAMLFAYSWKLALLVSVLLPINAGILLWSNRVNRTYQRAALVQSADLEAHFVESLTIAGTVKRLQLETRVESQVETRLVKLIETGFEGAKLGLMYGGASQFVGRLASVSLLFVGAKLVLEQQLSPGELMSCFTLLGYLSGPLTSLVSANRSAQEAVIAAERLFDIMDLARESDAGAPMNTHSGNGLAVEFHNVAFRYGARAGVLEGLSLLVPAAATVAIVGESGSGKSTVAALVQRLYSPSAGVVKLGDVDLQYVRLSDVRSIVGVVPQRVQLFSGTLLENITLNESPDLPRVSALIRDLGLDVLVARLQGGLLEAIGEDGSNLSGGERQRIAVARALYARPSVLILDEATSSLDAVAESAVMNALRVHVGSTCTIIIVAHRLSTVLHADTIYVLEGGRLVEQGAHLDLLRLQGKYSTLWRSQTGEVLLSDAFTCDEGSFSSPVDVGGHALV